MGRCIVQLGKDEYVEWSSVVEAPVTYIMSQKECYEHIRRTTNRPFDDPIRRIERLEAKGTTEFSARTAGDTYFFNHAGPDGQPLNLAGLREVCRSPEAEAAYGDQVKPEHRVSYYDYEKREYLDY
jgi:hypothetical protein